jgi:ubiquinone/menaquinone biosynthesis C-methylase UbiE
MNTYFDEYSADYIRILAECTGESIESASYFATQKVRHLRHCVGASDPPLRILDYGCGVGLSFKPLRHMFPHAEIVGADPSMSSIDIATKHNQGLDIAAISLHDLSNPCYRNYFDVIFVSCVFHHIEPVDHIATLFSLKSLCASTGKLIVFEHNPRNPITRKIVERCPFDQGVTLIMPRVLVQSMTTAGWTKSRTRYISFIPPILKRYAAVELLLSWCPAGAQYFVIAQPA